MKTVDIRLKGEIEASCWFEWFDGLSITHPRPSETRLHGPLPDMPAVYGLLEKLRNFGLEVLAVNIETDSGTVTLDANRNTFDQEEEE